MAAPKNTKNIGKATKKAFDRPPEDIIRECAYLHLNNKDIAMLAGVHPDTLVSKYRTVLEQGKADGKKAIRYAMFKSATKQNSGRAQLYLDQKLNPDPKDSIDISDKLQAMGKELYEISKKPKAEY